MPQVRENEIDGEALVFLKRDELMNELGMPEHECQVTLGWGQQMKPSNKAKKSTLWRAFYEILYVEKRRT